MKEQQRLEPYLAACRFVEENYPDCTGALLAGSVVRGQTTETSDLDIVIFDQQVETSYRESRIECQWPVEVFVHNLTSYRHFFKSDCARGRPSLPRMVAEGKVISGEEYLTDIKKEAERLLAMGPAPWDYQTIESKRYFLTDTLEDVIGATEAGEELFAVNTLAELLSEFILRTNQQWTGTSKWLARSLRDYDKGLAQQFINLFDHYYRCREKGPLIDFTDQVLKPYGGRLFAGFSRGKDS
ncbi:nucleotidyltransferase domain-containing protein [Halobacillus rhizosphaerae]|uniref:nucleotidyltransferase domain-containing protein n=1 Tax=Halobacillus rhizosphaerae TaxID=3064889 RepID=UPI00398B1B31